MNPAKGLQLTLVLGALIAAAPLAASAQPAHADSGKAEQCFLGANVDGFNAPDDHTVYLSANVHDVYRLDLMGSCTGLSFRQGIGLERTPGNSWICSPLDATIIYNDHGIHERCPVTAIHKLTPAELVALPKKDRP
jgi:hypothetical protein